MSKLANNQTAPLEFNPRSPQFRANPYPTYDYLRTHHPIYYRSERNDWVLTRYDDIVEVFRNPSFGRSQQKPKLQTANQQPINHFLSLRQESQQLMKLWLVLLNPPDHTRIRHLLRNPFTPSRIQTLRSHISANVNNFIDGVKNSGKVDIIKDLAYPLALGVNCKILGIPEQEWHPRFKQWSDNLSIIADVDVTPIANEQGLLTIAGLAEYFRSWIAKCRSCSQPQDNLIGSLIEAEANGEISEEELLGTCIFMFAVGHSSTANLIGNTILTLLNHPQQLYLLQADPSLIETTISEVLRYESPVQGISRTALSDIQLSNQTIHRGEVVNCIIAAANRDPAKFLEPNKFDIRRKPNPYLSFGQGIHNCIGKHLGRLVAEIAVGTVVKRLPELSIATESFEWDDSFLGRGLKSLPVIF
ncbi:cytochrome P450 [Rivularia sp. PCC 7116]|uniref:cytochrome P450 n=1 Tax=Rivularia sp. PCC 7116 TaxID=373994 RepID=UPI00029F3147|nr:cytochrome P450 [Rivularia sp. PCC 7116]AFY57880.1 cytochrome P450 [Rivularia sp. PCC 7116]